MLVLVLIQFVWLSAITFFVLKDRKTMRLLGKTLLLALKKKQGPTPIVNPCTY